MAARKPLIRLLSSGALVLAVVALALLAAGPLGFRAGWWHYRVGLQTLLPWAGYCGVAAIAAGLAALAVALHARAGRAIVISIMALIIGGGAAYFPWHYQSLRGTFVPIHDITTDWENPPQFEAVMPERNAKQANSVAYSSKISDQQRRWYPDIGPLNLDLPPAQAFERALAAARAMGWTIVATEPEEGRIEASESSRWFGFIDDVVVRVTAAGSGSRIDVRSVSRVGVGDFGVNAARVRRYLAALRQGAG